MSDGTSTPTAEQRLAQLARLRDLWLENRSTRQFVQIAEELRRLGDAEAAASLLEVGLESHPRYLSAQVALARCRVELGQAEAARGLLESVVEIDSTHPLATRLLVEAYLGVGDAPAAREKLELYRLLNAGDPQIERLEEGVQALEGVPTTGPGAVAQGGAEARVNGVDGPDGVSDAGKRDGEVEAPVATAGGASGPVTAALGGARGLAAPFELAGKAVSAGNPWTRPRGLAAPFAWSSAGTPAPSPAERGERGLDPPFRFGVSPAGVESATAGSVKPVDLVPPIVPEATPLGLGDGDEASGQPASPLRPLAGVPGGGSAGPEQLTEREPEDLKQPSAAEPSLEAVVGVAEERVVEALPVAVAVSPVEGPSGAEVGETPEVAELAEVPVEPFASEPSWDEGFDLAEPRGEALDEDRTVAPSERLHEEQPEALVEGPRPLEGIEPEDELGPPPGLVPVVAVAAAPAAGPLAGAEAAGVASQASLPGETTTLGQLYLRQGHSAEAERIFRRVLEREPANDTAREGLRQAMIATDLARAGAATPPRGITERKIHRLTGWVSRLRRT